MNKIIIILIPGIPPGSPVNENLNSPGMIFKTSTQIRYANEVSQPTLIFWNEWKRLAIQSESVLN